jgi:Holin of 3TMs, for gene-transfer release
MATSPNPIAGAIGTAVGSAAAAPLSVVSSFVNLGKDLIDRFVPDPQAKLAAQQHLADQAANLQMAQLDQQNKMMTAASANIQADTHMPVQRAYFCGGITSMLLFNYAVTPLLHAFCHVDIAPLQIPASVLSIFAVIMLGFVGIPAALQMAQTVAGMPGDSQVKLPFGLGSIGNKSS